MKNLNVYIEILGKQTYVGHITGKDYRDASFSYDKEYMNSEYGAPISVALPLREEPFSPTETKNFFEGLLPEGFSRKAVANWLKADEQDYLMIIGKLGTECLGAIMVTEGEPESAPHYEKLTSARVKELAAEGTTRSTKVLMETHLSLTGASGKVGLYYDEPNNEWYLPKGNAPSTHIVKQSHVRLDRIVLNEQLCILAAGNVGIQVPHSFIINLGKAKDDEVLYATRRYDRKLPGGTHIDGLVAPYRLHQEDFAQAMSISAADKYEIKPSGYLRKMFETVGRYTSNPMADQRKLLEIIIFDYLVGNTDCHIKNCSLIYSEDLRSVRLAPAYDIVSTGVYNMTTDMSFYIGGEVNIKKITRENFRIFAKEIGLSQKLVLKIFDDVANKFEAAVRDAADYLGQLGFKDASQMGEKILQSGGFGNVC
ncbi:MAG: HipA domain-containing protein [Butyrivibrio sp.]|nr:HipA domain-containing protein [Butyrivibrio sp.]